MQAPALIFQAGMPLIDALPQSGLCIYFRTRSSSPLRLSDRPWTKEVQKELVYQLILASLLFLSICFSTSANCIVSTCCRLVAQLLAGLCL